MEKWVEVRKSADFNKMSQEYEVSPIVARILRNKDLVDPTEIKAFLSPGIDYLHNPNMLSGIDRVIFLLKEKISGKKKIRIIGDYDVDGICATFILYKGLTFFGADCDYVIPHRIEDGYGINIKLIDDAKEAGIDTIVTCDNGIAASEQTDYAHSLGMTMIITDHHEVPFEDSETRTYIIPNADALTDPKLPDCNYPFKGICGAYVALQVIREYAYSEGVYDSDSFNELFLELLEFAALATVCDVMELKDENRSIVSVGSKLLSKSKNLGMRSLLKATEMEGKLITPYQLGFVIGPCLNASGRLDTSLRALSLFMETDPVEALKKAEDLRRLNEERKDMTQRGKDEAFAYVDAMDKLPNVLVVFLPECHESLAGIIAGKVRERYVRPAFVVTKTEKGLKGSGRSVDAYDMFECLNHPDVKKYLTKFGGHKLAAGISLKEEDLNAFIKALNDTCPCREEDFYETVKIDMELPFEYANLKLCRELSVLEPYGVGNERPLFGLGSITVISGYKLGKNENVGKYKVKDKSGHVYEMMYFGDLKELENYVSSIYDEKTARELHSGNRINVVLGVCYEISINSYMEKESVQIVMKHYR